MPKKITKEEVEKVYKDTEKGLKQVEEMRKEDTVSLKKNDFDALMKRLDTLENQGKMLTEVADKGRLMDYEMKQTANEKKPFKVKLPIYGGGYIVDHQSLTPIESQLIYGQLHSNPIGERQEYKVTILMPDNSLTTHNFATYGQFGSARYEKREEVVVIGRREIGGKLSYIVALPDGRETEVPDYAIN